MNTGDYNNDLTLSNTHGQIWHTSFTGTGIMVIAPKEKGAGKIEIQIDGKLTGIADLSTEGPRQPQKMVYEIKDLPSGRHSFSLINRGPGPVAIDALVIK